jgi:hypothetical protein
VSGTVRIARVSNMQKDGDITMPSMLAAIVNALTSWGIFPHMPSRTVGFRDGVALPTELKDASVQPLPGNDSLGGSIAVPGFHFVQCRDTFARSCVHMAIWEQIDLNMWAGSGLLRSSWCPLFCLAWSPWYVLDTVATLILRHPCSATSQY